MSLILVVILRFVCTEMIYSYRKKHLDKLSPKKISNLYGNASFKNDYDVLEAMIHPDSERTSGREMPQWQKGEADAWKPLIIILGFRIDL